MEEKSTNSTQSNIEDNTAKNSNVIPDWLKDTQNKSWEPEIIISGLLLTSLFIVPSKLFQLFTVLTQEFAVHYVSAGIILMYLTFAINVFKVFFVVHLLSRLVWAGLVGLSYAFPEGVDNTKLFKHFRQYHFPSPTEMVIKLEKWCSTMFGFPVYTGIIFSIFTLVLILLVGVSIYFEFHGGEELYIFLFLALAYTILVFVFKKTKLAEWMGTSLPNTISSIYQSNLGKWKVMIFVNVILLLSLPFSFNDMEGDNLYANIKSIDEDLEWLDKSFWYEEYHDKDLRYPRAFIKTEQAYDKSLILNIAHFKEDEYNLVFFKSGEIQIPDSLGWEKPEKLSDIFKVYLNDSLISDLDWSQVKFQTNYQKGFTTQLNIENLKPGKNVIRVEKICFYSLLFLKRLRVRERWSEIPFYKIERIKNN
ncbi:hypothetical protein [Chondrinema litorale]|uniref:hypothetical protein n=1 Tax=Chondrinema litorale TaxID=2994555 RepID=UPI002543B67D|nr:hypothetical protein [Chondrinema litorale]UZR97077.1 hypothetical protein OQ292_23545 [Chondrinema litorale]